MQIAYDTEEETDSTEQEIECLEILIKQLEGKTKKLKN